MEKTVVKARNYTDNFYAFLVEGIDILSTSQQYRSLESRYRAMDNAKHKDMFDRIKQRQALRQLKQRGWIEVRAKGKKIEYLITESGLINGLEVQMMQVQSNLAKSKCCYVIYDFPIGANKARSQFRKLLKRAGFERCQDSVWFTKKNVLRHMVQIIQYLKVDKWVKIIVGSELCLDNMK